MGQDMTIMINGIATGLFGLTAVLYLTVFKKNRLRMVLGVILAVYAVYLVKDILYLHPAVASDTHLYRRRLGLLTPQVLSPGGTNGQQEEHRKPAV